MSEFGRGYAVCLRQFLWHEPRLGEYIRDYVALDGVKPGLFGSARAIEMWADGAVDHLLDLVRPRRYINRDEWARAKDLRDTIYGAKWGSMQFSAYPSRPLSEGETRAYLATAQTLMASYARRAGQPFPDTFEAAWALDEAAGLKPQRGDSATCTGPAA